MRRCILQRVESGKGVLVVVMNYTVGGLFECKFD